ncbi:ATP-binding protein [Isoptericola sp. NPDC056605]|uniref:ATP-binding protein n=1 Tax=Isoptericola sp. NPDC056605 TaxID=3345876 RepID=UPI0036AECE55
MSHSQLTDMTHNLMWTRSGTVWAMWRLEPLPYGYRTTDAKEDTRALHASLFRALRGEGLLLGYCASTDPTTVVQQMIDGLDMDDREEWAAECVATLDLLKEIDIGRRAYWLAVPLKNAGSRAWSEPLRAAGASLRDAAAMPRVGPSPRQVRNRLEQAELIRKVLPSSFNARPATVAEMTWVQIHAQQRGLHLDLPVPSGDATDPVTRILSAGASIPDVHTDPSGETDLGRRLTPWERLKRRYLKVTNLETTEPSYQVMLAVANVPSGGIAFPGGEWLGRLDESGIPVDWALRLNVRGRDEVTARNRRANANLTDQFDQRSEENRAGGSSQLVTAASDLAEYQGILDSDELEVEVEHTAILAVGGTTPEEAEDLAGELAKHYARSQFKLVTDAAAQEALWDAMLPGVPTTRAVRELSQITTAHNIAAAVPVITSELGDDRGFLAALEISGGRPNPVLIDLAGAGIRMEVAMAIGVVGELGSGKSFFLKKCALDAVARGATLVAVDRTVSGEWATAVAPIPGSVVVDVSENARFSVDPIRIFGVGQGARIAQTFLTTLLNVDSTEEQGVLLSDVLEAQYLSAYQITSLGALVDHLTSGACDLPGAEDLGRKMNVFARKDFGAAIFNPHLPPLDMDAPAIVFWTALLELPDADELNNPMRFAQMSLEKKLGRAMYALITAIARRRCMSDSKRLGLFIVDEAHSVTSSPEGLAELRMFVRDGRKHLATIILGSHDPEADFGDEVLRGLIAFRVLMRHRDRTLAARGLRWILSLPVEAPVEDELVDLIANETSPVLADQGVPLERRGECLMRDFQGRIGRAKILPPATDERAHAILTTPEGADA